MRDQYIIDIRFAEDLLLFLYEEAPLLFGFRVSWSPKFTVYHIQNKSNDYFDSMFKEEVGWSVYYIIQEKMTDIVDCYEDLLMVHRLMEDDDPAVNFAKCALQIAPSHFSEGYSHEAFLSYCAMVMRVAYNFFLLKPNDVHQRACQVIGLVLFSHQMTGQFYELGGWSGFYNTAFNFNGAVNDWMEKRNKK